MKELNFGSHNIDNVYSVGHIVIGGDTFTGYFISSMVRGMSTAEGMKMAARAAMTE